MRRILSQGFRIIEMKAVDPENLVSNPLASAHLGTCQF